MSVRVSARIPLWLFGIDHGEITVIRRSLKLGQGCCADDTQATPGNANCSGKSERRAGRHEASIGVRSMRLRRMLG